MIRKHWKKLLLVLLGGPLLFFGGVLLLARLLPLPGRLYAAGSQTVLFAGGLPAHVFLSEDEKWRIPVDLDRVDPAYIQALLRLEDKRFYTHHGVDPWALLRAVRVNLGGGRVLSGGSTLSMQLARVLHPRPRSLWNKGVQMFRAVQLEMRLSKREILEAYLTFLPFGKNVEGIEAAALTYFGHPANALTQAEIATLLAVPQDPVHRYPSESHAERLRVARDRILKKLYQVHLLPLPTDQSLEQVWAQAAATPVPRQLLPFPRDIFHAAQWIRRTAPSAIRYQTHLDAGYQHTAERIVANYTQELHRNGIFNGAVLVVDHQTGALQAAIGNLDASDARHAGQMVAFEVPRSPGSTLKPLLYAQAIDQGLMLPDFLVPDVPMEVGTYQPHNYDKQYSGLVRMEDALSRSLNIPFVQLLQRVGLQRFLVSLRRMDAHSLHPDPGHYGLSIVAGGAELTPLEVLQFYVTLARGGVHRPLQVLRASSVEEKQQSPLWSAAAIHMTQQALSRKDRPDFPSRRSIAKFSAGIYWKTGTSFGHRDAWAVGSNATHTVLVWLGNLDNRSSSYLVGSEAPAPILFDLLEAIGRPWQPQAPQEQLKSIQVCADSGHPVSMACPHAVQAFAVAAQLPTQPCPYHVRWRVSPKGDRVASQACPAASSWKNKVFFVQPASVRRWRRDHGFSIEPLPLFLPGCPPEEKSAPPSIVSPLPAQTVLLIPGMPTRNQMVSLAADSAWSPRLHWFVDGKFLEDAPSEQVVFWEPTPGQHTISVVADWGQSARRTMQVRMGN